MASDNKTGLELRSLIKKSGELELSLASVPIPEPSPTKSWSAWRPPRSIPRTLAFLWAPRTCLRPRCPAPAMRRSLPRRCRMAR